MRIQVAIVSDQTLANLIPALMTRPDHAYLVCSDAMAERRANVRLERLLREYGVAVTIVKHAPDASLQSIRQFALELADRIDRAHPDAQVELNATGGTKLMALGFIEVFRDVASRIIYADTAHNRLEVLHDAQGQPHEIEMPQLLDVPKYLKAQGFAFGEAPSDSDDWRASVDRRKPTAKYLGRNAKELAGFFGCLNRLVNAAIAKDPATGAETLAC